MGGWGSGTWRRHGTKPLVEFCSQLDINELNRDGLLHPFLSYSVSWESGNSIGIKTFPNEIELSYTINATKADEELIRYRVPLQRQSQSLNQRVVDTNQNKP